jgi:hypothetical protein
MESPGTHHCSLESGEHNSIWCQGHRTFQWFPLQMRQGPGGNIYFQGHSLLKWPSHLYRKQAHRLGSAPEGVTTWS